MTKKSSRRVFIVDSTYLPAPISDKNNWKLLLACTLRHVPLAKEALSQNANINCRRSDYLTPLHIAVQQDDIELIQLLCEQPSINFEAKTVDGLTSLHKATFLKHINVIKKLIEYGAIVNCTDNLGRYPLHYAAFRKDIESATILLINGANVNVFDIFEESPLYMSVIRRPSLPMIKLLLAHGATVSSALDQISLGVLLNAMLYTRNTSDTKILDLLFQNRANVNTTDSIGLRTPLHLAAMTGNLKLAIYLIEKEADLYRKNRAGHTPMEVALMYRNYKIVRLIEHSLSNESKVHMTQSIISLTHD
ncbi:Ankyrin-3 [Habropoda laboriosa]|uniref:Ankyrin-3 n=1 Tax=Habropoda laboriosa TaxID=597456 RepID=A0A0L7R5Q5_9HYME|nr:PREDICTED: putative ankyrin repeat protein RF_0381 [Habropoda laboriosa]KOC66096.1 Ankyrin-3 [Habropoda laboriosa]